MVKNIKKFFGIILLCICFLSSCSLEKKAGEVNNVTNNITNNITENTTTVGDIDISDFENAFVVASQKVINACIGIRLKYETTLSGMTYEQSEAIGSGVIYKKINNIKDDVITNYTYYVITNRHVIEGKDASKEYHYYAYLGPEVQEIEMTLLGYDDKIDIACLTFEYNLYIEPVKFGNSSNIKTCEFAFAIGCPEGFEYYNSVTFGIISCPLRYLADDTDNDGVNDFNFEYIQHDVSINPGNSGGGLFNMAGELIGINTMKLVSNDIDNMGFSIPINIVKVLVEEYLEVGKEIVRPRLGVSGFEIITLNDLTISKNNLKGIPNIYNGQTPYGLYVMSIVNDGTISGTGIDIDDIILTIDDLKITKNYLISTKFNSLIDYKIGDEVIISYYDRSADEVKTTTAILASK